MKRAASTGNLQSNISRLPSFDVPGIARHSAPARPPAKQRIWTGYTSLEDSVHRAKLWKDMTGLVLYPAAVLLLGIRLTYHMDTTDAPVCVEKAVLSIVTALVGIWSASCCFFKYPKNTEDDRGFVCTQCFGSYVYLTRNNCVLQTCQLIFTAMAETAMVVDHNCWIARTLVPIVYTNAVFVAGLGVFVTLQFYKLVYFEPQYVMHSLYHFSHADDMFL